MSKRKGLLISVTVIVLAVVVFIFLFHSKGQSTPPKFLKVSIGQNVLLAEVADTETKRDLGLGGRQNLANDQGMIFIFDRPGSYGFWMKDTLIPLDMIWIDQNKKIVDLKSDVLPSTFPTVFYPTNEALYVLEVNAGYAESHEIKIGDQLNFSEK